jgi:hypothetical protein
MRASYSKYKASRLLNNGIKGIIFLLAVGFLFRNLSLNAQSVNFDFEFSPFQLLAIITAILLIPANWLIESWKWHILLKKTDQTSFKTAIRATLNGLVFSSMLPNRVGETLGRTLYLPPKNRTNGALHSVLTSASQLTTTLIIGLLVLPFYFIVIDQGLNLGLSILSLSAPVLILIGYFNLRTVFKLVSKWKWVRKKLSKHNEAFGQYSNLQLAHVLLLSIFRYFIFSIQFTLLIFTFESNFSIFHAVVSIPVIYLLTTTIPSFSLAELGLRESVAVLILGALNYSIVPILASTFSIWLLNIAVPTLIGLALLLFRKLNILPLRQNVLSGAPNR